MEAIFDSLGLDGIITLFDRVKELLLSCVGMIGKCFSWMGPEFIIVLTIGVTIAIILRIAGR